MEAGRPMNEVTRKLLLTIGGAFLLFGVSFVAHKVIGAGGPDTKISHHASLAGARQAGAVERGWVPELLPAGSSDITEIHDLDKNTGTGTFRFPSADLEAFKSQARRFGGADVKEAGTVTYVAYSQDRSRFELVLTPDPQRPDVMIGVWGMKPIR
ncbi:MAG: hypothetical protein RLZ85_809 [Verrucomicrobiota bacterium]|jgi:hypothetical protein